MDGNFVIELDVATSTDLSIWNDFDISSETLTKNAYGNIELEIAPMGNEAFYRFVSQETE